MRHRLRRLERDIHRRRGGRGNLLRPEPQLGYDDDGHLRFRKLWTQLFGLRDE
jgi:hypothetical protein